MRSLLIWNLVVTIKLIFTLTLQYVLQLPSNHLREKDKTEQINNHFMFIGYLNVETTEVYAFISFSQIADIFTRSIVCGISKIQNMVSHT